MLIDQWSQAITSSFNNLWYSVPLFILNLLVAVIIFLLGWLVGSVLGRWVAQLIKALKVDKALSEVGTDDLLARAGFRLDAGAFVGGLVKWFIVAVFLLASFDVLGLSQVTMFLREIIGGFLPNVIVAALILLVAAVIAEALQKIIAGSAMAAGVTTAKFLGGLTKWAIWIFALLVALSQVGIGRDIIVIVLQGVIYMLALAGGLAFGLGGKEAASRSIEKIREEMGSRR